MTARVLLYGYGNPGRLDDGLGPALAQRLEATRPGAGITIETGYQLQIEDAALVAEHDVVVFADADTACEAPFFFRPVAATPTQAGLTHFVSPGEVVISPRSCFGASPEGYLLGVRANVMDDFREGLTLQPGRAGAGAGRTRRLHPEARGAGTARRRTFPEARHAEG